MLSKTYYIYIMTNSRNSVLYTGVTNDLSRRIYEHKNLIKEGFSARYKTTRLVYYEECNDIEAAILREKQIKAGSRKKKILLIEKLNKEWRDLSDEII